MKKYFSLILVLILALTLFGCGKMNDEEAIKSTITKFFNSWENEDIVDVGDCIDDEYSDDVVSSKTEFLSSMLTHFMLADVSDISIVFGKIDIVNNLATAYVHTTLTQKLMNGETTTGIIAWEFVLIKRGSEWLIKSHK